MYYNYGMNTSRFKLIKFEKSFISVRCISFILTFLLFSCSNNIVLAKESEKGIKYIGEMNVQRALHASKTLDDGTVLIFGGYNKMTKYSNGYEPPSYHQEYSEEETSEIHNPIDNTFKITDLKTDLPEKKVYFKFFQNKKKIEQKNFLKIKTFLLILSDIKK